MQRSSWMHDLELYRMQPGCLLGARSLRVAEAVSARCSSNLFCTAWTAALRTAGCGGNGRCLKRSGATLSLQLLHTTRSRSFSKAPS